ncbi:MAG: putative ATPase [Psychroserpens sp.]|jgi:predicted ATPase
MKKKSENTIRIKEIVVEKFRQMESIVFPLGENITFIAGQNGTSKSTLLGMICQPFSFSAKNEKKKNHPDNSSYIDNYHDVKLAEYETLSGDLFTADAKDVFRFSSKHDRPDDSYEYRIKLTGDAITEKSPIYDEGISVIGRPRKLSAEKSVLRLVSGPKRSHQAGEGNFPHPVIYLGLSRLWPLAQCSHVNIDNEFNLDDDSSKWYRDSYNSILLILNENESSPEYATPDNGSSFLGVSSGHYDTESSSSGQGNIGQILTAILSFKKLKEKLGDKYLGGILLIDELDATLHACAQEKLLEFLGKYSKELNLQIVATTHSMYLLEQAFKSKAKSFTDVIYLKKNGDESKVIFDSDINFETIKNDLLVKSPLKNKANTPQKIRIICEDSVAKDFALAILYGFTKYFEFSQISMSNGQIANIAGARLPELAHCIFMADGDVKNDRHGKLEKMIFLPGSSRPESVLYDFFNGLNGTDSFWNNEYTKQITFRDLNKENPDKNEVKSWFNNQKTHFGRNSAKAYKRWIEDNMDECSTFLNSLSKIIEKNVQGVVPSEKLEEMRNKYISEPTEPN